MYLERSVLRVGIGRTAEMEARGPRVAELYRGAPGFLGGGLAVSLGQPNLYSPGFFWESRAAARAFRQSERYIENARTNPVDGLYTSVQPLSGYEQTLTAGPDTGNFVTFMQWTLEPTPAKITAFIASRQELFDLRQRHSPSPVRCLLYRYLGSSNRFLAAVRSASPEALQAADSPEVIQAFRREHPYSAYAATPPDVEIFEVVHRILLRKDA